MNFTGHKGTAFFRNTQELDLLGFIFYKKIKKNLDIQKKNCTFASGINKKSILTEENTTK